MIADFCTYVGNWPTYPLSYADPTGLLQLMDRNQIQLAFVSGLDALFAYSVGEANQQLARLLDTDLARLRAVGALNPVLPTWRRDLTDGLRLGLAGFRLHPAYHGYGLDRPEAIAAARAVGTAGLPVFVAAFVYEERFEHPALSVRSLPTDEIAALMQAAPDTTFVINNLDPAGAISILESRHGVENIWLDINAMDKPRDGLSTLVRRCGVGHLIFGSQAPFLYPEAALALALADDLSQEEGEAVLFGNWRQNPVLRHAAGLEDSFSREDIS